MIVKYSRISLFIGLPGLLLQVICIVLLNRMTLNAVGQNITPSPTLAIELELGVLAGNILLTVALCYYAKAKGYRAALGLLGLLFCLGLLVLALLPDRTKSTPK